MDRFALIKPLFKYSNVAYYSVSLEEDEKTIYDEFVEKHTIVNKDKLYHILKWLKEIGEKYGAQDRFFRNEAKFADTTALPPKGIKKEPTYVEFGKPKANDLRLYTFKLNPKVVFLFSGDIKTKQKAQDCQNVKSHFLLANHLTKAIENALKEKEVFWIKNFTEIDCIDDFKLYY